MMKESLCNYKESNSFTLMNKLASAVLFVPQQHPQPFSWRKIMDELEYFNKDLTLKKT
jgi:hypothetical protein